MAEPQVTIVGSHGGHNDHLREAMLIQKALNRFNAGSSRILKVRAMFFGAVALNRYRKMWLSSESHHSIDGDLLQPIPLADQVLEIGLYLTEHTPTSEAHGLQRIANATQAIRAALPSIPILICLLNEGTPFALPYGVRLPTGGSPEAIEHENWITVAHPSLFLMKTLKQIAVHQTRMDDPTRALERTQHRHQRNAHIRLIRIVVELLTEANRTDTRISDAVYVLRIDDARLLWVEEELKAEPGAQQAKLLNLDQAREEANWEAGLQGKQHDASHIKRLGMRNVTAFARIKLWVDARLIGGGREPPSCFDQCSRNVPSYEIIRAEATERIDGGPSIW